jgi:plasmid maintenance system antidote protein VapI
VLDVIKARIGKSSLRTVARELELSAAYLSDVVRGRRAVSDTIAYKFGFDREIKTEVVFTKVGK